MGSCYGSAEYFDRTPCGGPCALFPVSFLAIWFTGSEPVRVYAESLDGQLRAQGYHSEDAVFCLMRFANGALGAIEVNSHAPQGHPTAGQATMTIIGKEGMIELDLGTPWLTIADQHGTSFSQGVQKDLWFREEIDAFARHVTENGPNIATAADADAALRVSQAALESAATHRSVQLKWGND